MNTNHRAPLERLFGRVLSPLDRFLHKTTAGGMVLIAAIVLALLQASLWGEHGMHDFLAQRLSLGWGNWVLQLSLHALINDGLMALFFLLVGLELKREMLVGELARPRDASLPILAALGGMVVPALIYALCNPSGPATKGWAIPMATDIAFAIGILVLLAQRVPKGLVLFLTALAIADDLGAVLVIALFYTSSIQTTALAWALGFWLGLWALNRGGIRHPLPYAVLGVGLWYAMLQSGIHATLAGVAMAWTIPTRGSIAATDFEQQLQHLHQAMHEQCGDDTPNDPLRNQRMAGIAQSVEHAASMVQTPLQRMEHSLSRWVTFAVLPIFALANAGIDLTSIHWGSALSQGITLGVLLGLVLGKFVGISLFSWLAVRCKLGRLPQGVTWPQLLGAAWLGGIGFTMSLFVSGLAFTQPELLEQAKLGVLLASVGAATLGLAWLYINTSKHKIEHSHE